MKRWTQEDLEPQVCVAAVIQGKKSGEILIQKHTKLNKWTIPVGKVRDHLFLCRSEIDAAIDRELGEECGIIVEEKTLISQSVFWGMRNGKRMRIPMYLYLITSYRGEIQNLEPQKHEVQEFMNPKKLLQVKAPISHALRIWIKLEAKAWKRTGIIKVRKV